MIVEGFFDVYRLHQAGVEGVAIMGSNLSQSQKEQLESLNKELILMFDGDPAGQKGMDKAFNMISNKSNVRKIHLSENMEPEALSNEYIKDLIL